MCGWVLGSHITVHVYMYISKKAILMSTQYMLSINYVWGSHLISDSNEYPHNMFSVRGYYLPKAHVFIEKVDASVEKWLSYLPCKPEVLYGHC